MDSEVSIDDDVELLDDSWTPCREQLVFLIDCHPDMFAPLAAKDGINAESLFGLSLRVCIDVLRRRIIESMDDEVCIIFYGTKVAKNSKNHNNVHIFLELDYTDIRRIKKIGCLTVETFKEEIGTQEDIEALSGQSLRLGLIEAREILQNKANAAKSVLLFTSNPNPSKNSDQFRQQLLEEAKAIQTSHIFLRAFLLPYGSNTPKIEFWRDMNEAAKAVDEFDDFDDDVLARLENLSDGVRKKMFLKNPLARLKLAIFNRIEIDVEVYALIRQATKGRVVKLDSRTKNELFRATAYIHAETKAVVQSSELSLVCFQPKSSSIAADYPRVIVDKSELKELKTTCTPGINVLGFKSIDCLKPYHQLGTPNFIYPDHKSCPQNISTFCSLHESMLKTNTFALCYISTSRSAEIRLGALVPQIECKDEDGKQVEPPGFHFINLPFMDDIRNPEDNTKLDTSCEIEEMQIDAARDMIKALTLEEDFSTLDVFNPRLQRHFDIIEAKALEEEVPPVSCCVDETKPNSEWLNSNKTTIDNFMAVLPMPCDEQSERKPKRKQCAELEENDKEFVMQTDWPELARLDDLQILNVQQLKLYLRLEGLALTGKKEDLIKRIKEHLNMKYRH